MDAQHGKMFVARRSARSLPRLAELFGELADDAERELVQANGLLVGSDGPGAEFRIFAEAAQKSFNRVWLLASRRFEHCVDAFCGHLFVERIQNAANGQEADCSVFGGHMIAGLSDGQTGGVTGDGKA